MSFHSGTREILTRRQREATASRLEAEGFDPVYDPSQREDQIPSEIKYSCELTGAGMALSKFTRGGTYVEMQAAHLMHSQWAYEHVSSGEPEKGLRIENISLTTYQHPNIGWRTVPFIHYLYHLLAFELDASHHIGLTREQNQYVIEQHFIREKGVLKNLGQISVEQAFRVVLLSMSVYEDYTGTESPNPVSPNSPVSTLVMGCFPHHRSWFDRLSRVEGVSAQIPYAFKVAAVSYLFPQTLVCWDGAERNPDSGQFIGFQRVANTARGAEGVEGVDDFRSLVDQTLGSRVDARMAHSITPEVVELAIQQSMMSEVHAEFPYLIPERMTHPIQERWFDRIQRANQNNQLMLPGEIMYGIPNPDAIWAFRQVWSDYLLAASENSGLIIRWMTTGRGRSLVERYEDYVVPLPLAPAAMGML